MWLGVGAHPASNWGIVWGKCFMSTFSHLQ